MRSIVLVGVVLLCSLGVHADVNYQIDDGTAELALGIDPAEDQIWMTTFPVQATGEFITSISATYGRPGLTQALNGLAVSVLLYEDLDGGSPQNAVLKLSLPAVVANGQTNIFNTYNFPPTQIQGSLVAAILFRNTTANTIFIAGTDRTAPHSANRSFAGWTVSPMNEANLLSIPIGQWNTIEGFGFPGNFTVRAQGIPEPNCALLIPLALGCLRRIRR